MCVCVHVCVRACMRTPQLSSLCQGNEPYFTAASNSSLRHTSHQWRNTLRYWLFCLDGLLDDGWAGMLLGAFIYKAPQAILY